MYKADDGLLSFRADYVSEHPRAGQTCEIAPTLDECEKLIPFGWELFIEPQTEHWRAKPMPHHERRRNDK